MLVVGLQRRQPRGDRVRTGPGNQHRRRSGVRCILGILIALLLSAPAPVLAHHAGAAWTGSASLFERSHGQWKITTHIDSVGELHGVLTVHGGGLSGRGVSATMALMHLS
jgi:hypothetical protein